jgi:hypothetical protein
MAGGRRRGEPWASRQDVVETLVMYKFKSEALTLWSLSIWLACLQLAFQVGYKPDSSLATPAKL